MHISTAAYTFSIVVSLVILFHGALIIGMPWGSLTMGGRYPGQLPPRVRIASAIQILILSLLSLIVLIKAEILLPEYLDISQKLIWVVVAISGLSLLLNLATPSKFERMLWAPVALIMVACSTFIAFN